MASSALPTPMSILVWNCRGLGNPQSIRIFRKLTKEKCPFLVFLVETKARKQQLEDVRRRLKLDGCFAVDNMDLSGGIAPFWKEDWNVRIINYTRWYISALIKEEENGHIWQFTGFYGHPETAKRSSSWQLLEMLKPHSHGMDVCRRFQQNSAPEGKTRGSQQTIQTNRSFQTSS
ncbi:hypothetical protein CIPAW_01G073500 [Carya illinoinensis]|uniref:Endonuclease/exonuclease/phosphatase domain-containing protein n=1 Tax=Carya illinoinensis TaxID=32201 RepID=A0A8T1RL31_CARIL|nr:hypothetical protein CIPAW_01G073500 [Carya illinoinensis]